MLLALQQNLLLGDVTLVTVPDVVGQTQASGTTTLQGLSFVVAVATAYSSTVPAGTIISQSPTGGTDWPQGGTVTITVSLGDQSQSGAGRPRKKRRRAFVEIDGQTFEVSSKDEALELLQRARAIAERQAEQRAKVAESNVSRIARRIGSVPQVRVITPVITASPDLGVGDIIKGIERLYTQAAELAELRVLLQKQMDEEDEELLLL